MRRLIAAAARLEVRVENSDDRVNCASGSVLDLARLNCPRGPWPSTTERIGILTPPCDVNQFSVSGASEPSRKGTRQASAQGGFFAVGS
jgi:hypothetical protein